MPAEAPPAVDQAPTVVMEAPGNDPNEQPTIVVEESNLTPNVVEQNPSEPVPAVDAPEPAPVDNLPPPPTSMLPEDAPNVPPPPLNPGDELPIVHEPVPEGGFDESMTQEELAEHLKLQVVDVSHGVVSGAIDNAEAHLAEQSTQKGFKGFLKRIWHGNIARDFIRQREIHRGREAIVESGNVYELQDRSITEHDAAMDAVVTRFTNDFLHEENGEAKQELSEDAPGAHLELEMRDLVSRFARSEIDADVLQEEKTRVLDNYGATLSREDRNKGLLMADNLQQVAETAKAAFEHGIAIERIQAAMSASGGEARLGARTEARRDATDKIIDKIHSSRIGSLVNEATIGVGVGIAMSAAKFTTRKVTTAVAAVVGMGVGAGLVAGAREHARVGQERSQDMREFATGQPVDPEAGKRRADMAETRYETMAAKDLIDRLEAARDSVNDASPATILVAMRQITEAQTRIEMSDEQSIDLIDFSGVSSVEQERLRLDMALAAAKVSARQAMEGVPDEALREIGVDPNFDASLENGTQALQEFIGQDVSAKDAVFKKLRRNRTAKMALVGAVSGIVVGDAIQEARSLLTSELDGVFDGSNDGADHRTLMAAALGMHSGSGPEGLADGAGGGDGHTVHLGEHATVRLPEGYHFTETDEGGRSLVDGSGNVLADHLKVGPHGHFTEASRHSLENAGLLRDVHQHDTVHHSIKTTHVERTPHEYLHHHPNEFTKVQREGWYDNDTPGVFDQNELRMWWGGDNGTGLDEHGNYVFNMQHMMPDDSYHDGLSANAQQLVHEGKMGVALSMTQGTETHVVMMPVDEHGNVHIKADSWMAKSMFETQEGKAHFTGAYAEAVQLLGKDHHDTEHMRMLATVVGDGQPKNITEAIHHHVTETVQHTITTIHAPEQVPTGPIPIEIPPVVPIYSRRGLERIGDPARGGGDDEPGVPYIYVGGGSIPEGYRDADRLLPRDGLAPFAPELEDNPDAKIDADKAAKRYIRALRPSQRRVIEELGGELEEQPKATDPKVVVMIPAAAHQEGKNIYKTLEQYSLQEGISPDDFEIVVFANYPKDQTPDATIDEVKRFQGEHPELKVRLIEKALDPHEAKIGWIRKAVTDTVINDLVDRDVSLENVMLVSNDADSEWINPNYLSRIVEKAEASPETDCFLGFIDWSYEAYKSHPEMLVSTRFMQMIETHIRISRHEVGSSGANFAFRPGIYTAVGGYKTGTSKGEDNELGRMVKSVRAGAPTRTPIAFLGRSSQVTTSARRALETLMKTGGAPAAQWDGEFGANDELRNKEFDLTPFDYDDPVAVDTMVKSCERMLNHTLDIYTDHLARGAEPSYREGRLTRLDSETIRQINRIGFFLGISIGWQPDGSLQIVEAGKMIEGLKEWQAKN